MVSAIASSAQHTLLEEGLEVTVTGAGESHDFDGRIASVGTESVDRDGLQGFEIWVETDAPLPPEVFGYALEVRAVLRATPRAVLAVPVTALSTRADGAVTVVKATGEEAAPFTVVVVRPGLSAGGFVEIAPPLEGDLRRGDRVVVSR
jgi:multidrug efflux pump subunit AcrA (membrane-fusion protein)